MIGIKPTPEQHAEIIRLRMEEGLSLGQIATIVGFSKSTISAYCKNLRPNNPSPKTPKKPPKPKKPKRESSLIKGTEYKRDCTQCGYKFKTRLIIDGKERNLRNRTKCLKCMPFGTSNYHKKSPEEARTVKAQTSRASYRKKYTQYGKGPQSIRRERRKQFFINLIGGCQICGYNKCLEAIQFHHLRDKKFSINGLCFGFALSVVLEELAKCVVLCSRCHTETHMCLIDQTIIKSAHDKFVAVLEPYRSLTEWRSIVDPV